MEKAIKLLSLVDEHNFIEVYFVCKKIKNDYTIESIAFFEFREAQQMAEFKNKNENTNIYGVYRTSAHI